MEKLVFINHPYSMLFLLCFFFYFGGRPASCKSNETDFSALLAFKHRMDDDPFGSLRSWNETEHFCDWEGILCSRRHRGRVVSINLRSQGLVGSLSPQLGNLSFLRVFVLQNNSFYGEIPEEFGRLRRLEVVEFSNNSFSGEIPRNLSRCSNLYYLNLIDNQLEGTIFPEVGSIFKLEALGLMKNNLSGTIPPSIGNLTSLRRLSLSFCGLQGEIPESFIHLQRLRFLSLGYNYFTGEIPYGLYNISSLTHLYVNFNRLHGKIPWDVGLTLPKLKELNLAGNDFDGNVPVSLSNASFLERLSLSSSKFTGQVLIDFSRLSALQVLLLYLSSFEGDLSFISSLTNCTKLEVIDVGGNLFSGSLPDSIGNLSSKLSLLNIRDNQMHGTIPAGIQNLIGLTRLVFDFNLLQGSIPAGIGKLMKLKEIYMVYNQLTNEIPSSLGNLTLLTHVFLEGNDFYGAIPKSLSNCTRLLSLALSSNYLSGQIPQELATLSSIWSIDLSRNDFTGSIPVENGSSLINLSKLDLSHNRMQGLIPKALSSCVVLERLRLRNNSLEGVIPTGLVALQGLQELDLSQNNLSGSVPNFLGNMLNLKSLNLSFNKLRGEVPTQGVFRNRTAISLQGNDHLCGGIDLLDLPPCESTNFKTKNASHLLKILISTLGGVAVCVILCACIYKLRYRKRISEQEAQNSVVSYPDSFLRLSYADLFKATDGFSETNLLGSGRFGSVYRGILGDKLTPVAVKVFNLEVRGASKSFVKECEAIKGIRHRNLLKILSVCKGTNFQGIDFVAVVYEHMPAGSLEKWLHKDPACEESVPQSESNKKNLRLTQRLNVVTDVASAVEYLHCGNDSVIIHGDLKPSNILLDENMTAHVGDFGLTRVASSVFPAYEGSSSSMAIKGTIGYIPPEYGTTNTMTTLGDVYSFGILVLEMFTNIRPNDDASLNGRSSLHHLVNHALKNQDLSYVMSRIFVNEDTNDSRTRECVSRILEIGVACSFESPKDRMAMSDVVRELNKILKAYQ
ncbi:serine-threonine protein kinase, plant-type [Dorcoceras hygrometricum]|uniref:non-specific serine/threonine protein kinase n=1 Tax=Dorcoceras hygrometricum TaxID=472368 RepID=A0A2Z7DGL9_9LAMI|nr:serine-threonine protein kinase, plant-type [Dorcoceras hygrometricum]